MNLVKYLFSREFFKSLIKSGVVVGLIVFGTWLFLRSYTKHGEKVMVPNVVDVSISEAQKKLSEYNLSYKVIDSVFVKGKAGMVYAQIPKDSSFVKSEREIYLKVYRTIPPQKPVRFKIGEPTEIAKTKLLSKGFEIELKYQPGEFNDVLLGAYHADKELVDGDLVGQGEKIKLIISEKKSESVRLPNLYGLSLEQVKTALTEASLNLDLPLYGADVLTKTDTISATVYKQLPAFKEGVQIRVGSPVNIWLDNSFKDQSEETPEKPENIE